MKPRLILNAAAGSGRAAGTIDRARRNGTVEVVVTHSAAETSEQARRAVAEGLERLLVAGGDGTLHHAIQSLAGTPCALGIVPLGSGNDLVRALGGSLDPETALARALDAEPRTIDLGRVGGVAFAGIACIGFDAEVARRAAATRLLRGPWIYPWAVLRTLLSFRAPTLRVDHGDGRFEGPVMLVALANSPCYGGGMRLAPEAALDDGCLDLVVVREVSAVRLLAVFPRVYRGTHARHPAVRMHRVRSATVESETPLTLYADGEPVATVGPRPTRVEIWPRALRVVA